MWQYTELSFFLSSIYYRHEEILSLLVRAGIKPQFISQNSKAIVFWTSILEYCENAGRIDDLLKAVLQDGHENNEYLKAVLANKKTSFKSPYSNISIDKSPQIDAKALEKLTEGKNTILPISFLENGITKSKSVVRIVTSSSLGSGFILKNGYLLTNNHVIETAEQAKKTKIQFNYQLSSTGTLLKFEEFSLDIGSPNSFITSVEDDWTIVKIKNYDKRVENEYGCLLLETVKVENEDYVNIIQHPGGEHKQIALYHNVVVGCDDRRIQYFTDTLPGSSGSPVFNSRWQVVALHHAGSKQKLIGKSDIRLVNEGININLIIKQASKKGIIIN